MSVRLWSLLGNRQKLDGGAMFGNAPRAMWAKWVAVESDNRIDLACRALLAEDLNGKRVLFETGIGAFSTPSYVSATVSPRIDTYCWIRSPRWV